ncbi:hypothetical protein CGCF415_v007262 [Colletotrichum fructicola]|uniref:Uncharacterized protein n=1 Tax=Colletotrichum fructicola (strain Nara gc5) TaxID=1213859 RepID=A0A7J6J5D7_COLFN|nr:hypothetical protein CGGC5_v008602 [Colletotrichum fructicola Nara gc5]KAF4890559.1 hypothetical protein CGCFRS4_v008711 [Colletotrichum fructicola]KAF4907449.1 hypothetical protein CGCF415_v007262 [Colletotrichum fructicola]KAF4936383.1 hypothetical protein CGCF245_v006655 [Colletotrichum fructicola]
MPPRRLAPDFEDHHIRIDVLICGLRLDKLRIRDIPRASYGCTFVHTATRISAEIRESASWQNLWTCLGE